MFFFDNLKSGADKKGVQVADLVIALGADNEFRKMLMETERPMALRLEVDHIFVCSGAAVCALTTKMRAKPDNLKRAYGSMMNRLTYHLQNMGNAGVFNVHDIIVDESEKSLLLQGGRGLDEMTDIFTLSCVIGGSRMVRYGEAITSGLFESEKYSDGTRLTAKLMQETIKSCGEDDFPYFMLKIIYTDCIMRILQMCDTK